LSHLAATSSAALVLLVASNVYAQTPPESAPGFGEDLEVTATRVPRPVNDVPASIQVISADDLRARGATDLKSALNQLAGIDIAPGGDNGPASVVPEFWGLKEADAYLLIVDGVPWGGAFNPAVSTLDLDDVERIEIQRGPAPVMYGATSFVGVIQVIRRSPGQTEARAVISGGSYTSGGVLAATPLPKWLGVESALSGDLGHISTGEDRTSFDKAHILSRNRRAAGDGVLALDFDFTLLRQAPSSPAPLTGTTLDPLVPVGSNQNPADSFLNENRYFLRAGYDLPTGFGSWSSVVAYTHSYRDVFRGFLTEVSTNDPNANGFRQNITEDDVYLNSYVALENHAPWKLVAGVDWLFGVGTAQGGDFDYFINLDGSNAPTSAQLPPGADIHIQDHRSFFGAYTQVEWFPIPVLRLEGGIRLNVTRESRSTSTLDLASGDQTGGSDLRTDVRPSGGVGATFTVWQAQTDGIRVFANWKNTFKPAAVDFGLDSPSAILKPETANSYEAGLKGDFLRHNLRVEVSAFWMDFENLVIPVSINGLPSLANAGSTRLRGVELSAAWQLIPKLWARGSYAWHDATFQDYVTDIDGVPTQLAGNRIEMSPHHLASLGLAWFPARGFFASADLNYVGSRYLDKENTALADGYLTLGASAGYRFEKIELRVTGRNLTNRRDPVSESELGEGQYYRLPPWRVDGAVTFWF
jgi:outer membrane receptor protein involved in Fe transport